MSIYIKAIGTYLPVHQVDNYSQAEKFGLGYDFIDRKIGVISFHKSEVAESSSDMGVRAVSDLFNDNDLDVGCVEAIVVVTQNGDSNGLPHTAGIIQHKLGLGDEVSTFDISLGCSGYVYALSILKSHMLEMGFSNALLITVDPYTKIVDVTDKNTSLLFGDAATATLLSSEGFLEIGKPSLQSNGAGAFSLFKDEKLYMDGRAVFKFAISEVPKQINNHLFKNEVLPDVYLIHQGSKAIVDGIRKKLNLDEAKLPFTIGDKGNTVSSTIPLMLKDYLHDVNYQNILISGFGVGLSWATNLLTRREKNDRVSEPQKDK